MKLFYMVKINFKLVDLSLKSTWYIRDGATISKVGGLNFLRISSPTFWVTSSYTWTKLKESLKSPSIRKLMPYFLFLSINTTLTTSHIVFNYRSFPWYQGTSYFCWKCIPKNTSLWEIIITIFTRYFILYEGLENIHVIQIQEVYNNKIQVNNECLIMYRPEPGKCYSLPEPRVYAIREVFAIERGVQEMIVWNSALLTFEIWNYFD